MKKETRDQINRSNAQYSTGPVTEAGKERSSMNAYRHGLTGSDILLQANELEAYLRLQGKLRKEFAAQTELEAQYVQKIVDCHFRLNRISAIDTNILNMTALENNDAAEPGGPVEEMTAQTKAWISQSGVLDKLTRYEARIARNLREYTKELRLLQQERRSSQPIENKKDEAKMASFRQPKVMTASQTAKAGFENKISDFKDLSAQIRGNNEAFENPSANEMGL
jgi:hypothetical protein